MACQSSAKPNHFISSSSSVKPGLVRSDTINEIKGRLVYSAMHSSQASEFTFLIVQWLMADQQ